MQELKKPELITFADHDKNMLSHLQIDNLTKSFGDLVLFENISFQIPKGKKVALVGRNGAGKTTLLKIVYGLDSFDSGSVIIPKDITTGFLEQEPVFNGENTVLEQLLSIPGELTDIIKEYEASLFAEDKSRLRLAMDGMDKLNAWDYEAKMKQILGKLKISDLRSRMKNLSGGQRKRVAFAGTLIREPDLLLLDEPTNHLDLDMIEWLEEYLQKSNVTLLMVTHDRYFLDRVCDEVIEIESRKIYRYHGNYTYFLEKKEERYLTETINADKAQNLLRKELEWIHRQPKARTTKSKSRIDSFYELKELAGGNENRNDISINVKSARLGNKIINAKDLNKSYGALQILKNFSYNFNRFEKVGIIGNNGTGKSTFLDLLTGNVLADSGIIEVGKTITFGYYRQEGISFDEKMKVIDAMRSIAEIIIVGNGEKMNVSQFLNYFMFPFETQNSFISKLSGGEKRRLYLASILMKNPNFLLLDEPTNDIDIQTLNVLEDYLRGFKGCLIIVSHDRYFLDKVVDHLFVFEGNGNIKLFPGNYSDYSYYRAEKTRWQKHSAKQIRAEEVVNPVQPTKSKRFSFKEQREHEKLSVEIARLETEYKDTEFLLNSGGKDYNETARLSEKLNDIIKMIDIMTNRWIELEELRESQ